MDIQHRESRQTVVTFGEDDPDIIAACAYSTQRFRVDRASIEVVTLRVDRRAP